MTTVRDILADNPSGISRPGLLAWSRLRIDPEMTDAQLEDELALLGDDIVERQGFLYLRGADATVPGPAPGSAGTSGVWGGSFESPPPAVQAEPAPTWAGTEPEAAAPAGWVAPSGGVGRTTRILIAIAAVIFGVGTLLMGLLGTAIDDIGSDDPGGGAGGGTIVDANALAVGDCFDVPPYGEFETLRLVDCTAPHGGEVFLVRDYEGDPGGLPTDAQFERWVEVNCDPAFDDYTGSSWEEQDLLDIGWFMPVEAGWELGDREMVCWLAHTDGSDATRSYRGANP